MEATVRESKFRSAREVAAVRDDSGTLHDSAIVVSANNSKLFIGVRSMSTAEVDLIV
jgi:hypothetical protein